MNISVYARLSLLALFSLGTVPLASAQSPAPAAPAPAPAPATYDFGDGKSVTLTTKAWDALGKKDYAGVMAYTTKCIEDYKQTALDQQGTLKAPATAYSANTYWALNDVGTCYYIQGKALDDQGDKKGATADYKLLTDSLGYCQCWDPKGWFWSPSDVARARLLELTAP